MQGGYQRENITVVAKTYPESSKKYGALVCTAGINAKGQWRRLYPVPWALFFGGAAPGVKYDKYDIISLPIRKALHDARPESYQLDPYEIENNLKVTGKLALDKTWKQRRDFLIPHVDTGLESLDQTGRSLGLIKPRIDDFIFKERNKADPGEQATLDHLLEEAQQALLPGFDTPLMQANRTAPKSLPWIGYKYRCQSPQCRGHEQMCIDWEIQELYRKVGFDKTREKAIWMAGRDIYFVVGTTWRFQTWLVIGLFYPPKMGEA